LLLEDPLSTNLLFALLDGFLGLRSLLGQLRDLLLQLLLGPSEVLELPLRGLKVFTLRLELLVLLAADILYLTYCVQNLLVLGSDLLFNEHLALEVLLHLPQLLIHEQVLLLHNLIIVSQLLNQCLIHRIGLLLLLLLSFLLWLVVFGSQGYRGH